MEAAIPHFIQDFLRPFAESGDLFKRLRQFRCGYEAHFDVEETSFPVFCLLRQLTEAL